MFGFLKIELIESSISLGLLAAQIFFLFKNSLHKSFTGRLIIYLSTSAALLYFTVILNISLHECNAIFLF